MPIFSQAIKDLVHAAPAPYIATHDARLQPSLTRVMGFKLEDSGAMLMLLPKPIAQPTLGNLKDNGRFSFTACNIANFETYQIKGKFLGAEEATPQELVLKELYLTKFLNELRRLGYPDGFCAGYAGMREYMAPQPAYALRCQAEEVYLQTPGPKAGSRLWPAN
jgi:hypothetical protein